MQVLVGTRGTFQILFRFASQAALSVLLATVLSAYFNLTGYTNTYTNNTGTTLMNSRMVAFNWVNVFEHFNIWNNLKHFFNNLSN